MRQPFRRRQPPDRSQRILPLGDQAALVYCVSEQDAFSVAEAIRRSSPPWLIDVVSAYSSLAIFFDLDQINFGSVTEWFRSEERSYSHAHEAPVGRHHVIPCCYEYELDMDRVARHTGQSSDQIVAHHTATEYTVYAIGFCPGFPYLGYVRPEIADVPRLDTPRVNVAVGSVGLTGRQTGIYTEARPGGWNIIGQTPLELVNVADGYFPLHTGDRVQFRRIDEKEFQRLCGERLLDQDAKR